MADATPIAFRHGPLTVYLKSLPGTPDLSAIVRDLPPQTPVVWLDSARHHPVTGRWSMVGFDPWLTLRVDGDRNTLQTSAATHVWRDHPLTTLRQVLRRYRPTRTRPTDVAGRPPRPALRGHLDGGRITSRAIGLMGFLSYDLNRWIERLPPPQGTDRPVPDMLWFGMRTIVLVDHLSQRSWLLSVVDPHRVPRVARRDAIEALNRLEAQVAAARPGEPVPRPSGEAGDSSHHVRADSISLDATSTQAEFEAMVARALDHIRAGDIFQANVSQRFTMPWHGEALPLYDALRRINPSPFATFLSSDACTVVSCSPERLVRVQDGRIDTRPIAGTRPRGLTPGDDALKSLELLLSDKERAEHIMLVDLARNDLGRVCVPGSVAPSELMTLEDYSHVMHIVSDVSGVLRRGTDAVEVIRAVFPGGTITGCPKVRCMQILRELEPVPRGLYTGSLGYLGFDGTLDLNIAIRTMVIQRGQLSFHVGAGIVADSTPDREYQETLDKAATLMLAVQAVGSGLRAGGSCPEPRTQNPEWSSLDVIC